MSEVEKKGIGKTKIGLLISGILIVILAFSSLWLYTRVDSLQRQVSTLQTDNDNLQAQVSSLQTDKSSLQSQVSSLETEYNQLQTCLDGNITNYESQIATLNSQIDSLEAQITSLQSEIDSLKAPQLHLVNFESTVTTVWLGTDYVTVKGTIFNSGSNFATNVVFTVRIYDSRGTLLKTEQIAFGTISGKPIRTLILILVLKVRTTSQQL